MHRGKDSHVNRTRTGLVALLVIAVAMLTLASAASGSSAKHYKNKNKGPSGYVGKKPGKWIGSGHGYGETYRARSSTLAHALFQAKLLPKKRKPRNIALAAYGRATIPVNYKLAYKCWKNNGCNTGTGGKLTVAYVEGFGENAFRQEARMEFILQALTYPSIGKIIYRSAHSNLTQAIADFKSMISQHVSAIVTYPDFGDAMLPVFLQAKAAGIPVSTYAWGKVTGPGKNYTTMVGENTCKLGKAFAKIDNKYIGSGNVAFLGGFPGNPLSVGWQTCEKPALNPSIHVVGEYPTNWDPSMVQSIVAGILAKYPDLKGLSYEDSAFMAGGGLNAYKAAGIPYQGVFTYRTDEPALGCMWDKLTPAQQQKLRIWYYTGSIAQIRISLTADMMKLKGAKIPPTIVFPIKLQQQDKRDLCIKGYPMQTSPTALIPLKLVHEMYPK